MTDKNSTATEPTRPNRPRNRGLPLLLILVFLLVIGAAVYYGLASTPSISTNSTPTDEIEAKGGLINTPVVATLPATGPVEPTPAPTQPPIPRPTLIPTINPTRVPVVLPTATVPPTPSLRLVPKRIRIEAIGVNTFVERLGVDKKGNMDVPKNIFNVGWFGDGGYTPGDNGNAVIAGHLDAPGTRAVFWDLDKLKPGDKIVLTDDARSLTFQVVRLQAYPYNNAPLQDIFGPATEPHLNLITCNGTFDRYSANYNKRLIVFSRLVDKG